MYPGLILFIAGIGATLGVMGYIYHQGKQSCISYYEHLSVQNELKNKQAEAKNYQEQAEYNELLVGEATVHRMELENRNAKLQQIINKMESGGAICVDTEFLRSLKQLRGASGQKTNTKSTK